MKNNQQFVDLFEQRLCEYTGAPYAVAVDRCTNAILLSLIAKCKHRNQLVIPSRTYLSVPMTLINWGMSVRLKDMNWKGHYEIGRTGVYDYAVGFEQGMYKAGEIQCLSFQQKKRLAIGHGGAILLDDKELYNTLRRLRHDGRDSSISVAEENPDDVLLGYHMYMSPDEAARGTLLLNQLSSNYENGSSDDYPDCTKFKVLKGYSL